jgi:hypothetical protein
VTGWHAQIGDPTLDDSILDRLVHNASRLDLTGESIRKKKGWDRRSSDREVMHERGATLGSQTADRVVCRRPGGAAALALLPTRSSGCRCISA